LVNYLWGQTIYPININFGEYAEKGNHVKILSSSLSKHIQGHLNQSTKILSIKPDTLEFIYTRGDAKKLPVKLCGEVKTARQYFISDIILSPDSVMVYAPHHILDTMQAVYTERIHVEEASDTIRQRICMMPLKGAKFLPSYTDATFLVDVYSEKTVEVPVVGVNFPSDKVLRTFPSKVHVTFQIGLSRFKSVTADDFEVVVDYNDLFDGNGEKCLPKLVRFPSGVHHIRISPKDVDYIIEQKVTFND
jgi:YbbR domain-containing protein